MLTRKYKISKRTVQKILKKYIKKRLFKAPKREYLSPQQKLRRLTLTRKLLKIPRLTSLLENIWFTDESWFTTVGIAQKSKSFYSFIGLYCEMQSNQSDSRNTQSSEQSSTLFENSQLKNSILYPNQSGSAGNSV